MAGRLSKIIYDLYSGLLDSAVNDYITSNFDPNNIINLKYQKVTEIYGDDESISFYAEYEFYDSTQNNLLNEHVLHKCYVPCKCRISEKVDDFEITSKVQGGLQRHTKRLGVIKFTDDLIPIEKKYPVYNDVTYIFNKYDRGRKSIEGVRVNVYKLAELIGLKIYHNYDLNDINKSAMICLCNTKLSLLNLDTGVIETRQFEKGSIILNKPYIDERGPKSANFAIAHEIYHWLRHRYFITLKHIINNEQLYHTTLTRTKYFWKNEDERIEVQANKFAGILLLQDRKIYMNFLVCINKKGYLFNVINREKIVDNVLGEFSDLYMTTKKTLAIVLSVLSNSRLSIEELNKYKNDFKQEYYHYEIYEKDFINLYISDNEFYDLINSRKLLYIKKRVVLNISEAVNNGRITQYAKENPDKYFVRFTKSYVSAGESLSTVLNNNSYKEKFEFDKNKNVEVLNGIEGFNRYNDVENKTKKSLGEQLCDLRTRAGYTQEDVEEKIKISRQSISGYEHNKQIPQPDNLVKLIKLYGAEPYEIDNVMSAAGHTFNNDERLKCISYFLHNRPNSGIEVINECLRIRGFNEIL